MARKPKKINVVVVERGKEPRSILLDPSAEGIASVLGDGPTEYLSLSGNEGVKEIFLFAVMVSRTEDLDEMERNGDSMPRINLICGIGRRGIVSLPEEQQASLRKLHRMLGDEMLVDSRKTRQMLAKRRQSAQILPLPAS